MIRFMQRLPVVRNDFDVIFTDSEEIKEHIKILCEEKISYDTIIYVTDQSKKLSKDRAFSFFVREKEEYFITDNLNPLYIGDEVVSFLQNVKFREANGEKIDKIGFMQFMYELYDIRYSFYSEILGFEYYDYKGEKSHAIQFTYPKDISKYDKRNLFRLPLTLKNPVHFFIDENYETRAVNISAGGVGIINKAGHIFRIGEKINFYLEFPYSIERLYLYGEVRFLSANRIGIQFLPSSDKRSDIIHFKRKITKIHKFVTSEQAKTRKEEKEFEENVQKKRGLQAEQPQKDKIKKKSQKVSSTPEKIEKSYIEINKPNVLIIDNIPQNHYSFISVKYNYIISHYIRAEANLRLNNINVVVFNPDYPNFANIAKFLSKDRLAVLTPKLVVTKNFTRNFIISLKADYNFNKILKIPLYAHKLISILNEFTNLFPVNMPQQKYKINPKLKRLKYLFVSNINAINYGLSQLFFDHGIESFDQVNNGHKLVSKLNDFKPDILILDSYLNEINSLRLSPILKRNSNFKNLKIVLLITTQLKDYIEKIKEYQIDRYIFYPTSGEDIFDVIESLLIEI